MLIGASRQNVTTGNTKANLSDIRTTMENKELIFVKNSVSEENEKTAQSKKSV